MYTSKYFIIIFLICLYFLSYANADCINTLRLDEGKLGLEFKGNKAYFFNEVAGKKYYYLCFDDDNINYAASDNIEKNSFGVYTDIGKREDYFFKKIKTGSNINIKKLSVLLRKKRKRLRFKQNGNSFKLVDMTKDEDYSDSDFCHNFDDFEKIYEIDRNNILPNFQMDLTGFKIADYTKRKFKNYVYNMIKDEVSKDKKSGSFCKKLNIITNDTDRVLSCLSKSIEEEINLNNRKISEDLQNTNRIKLSQIDKLEESISHVQEIENKLRHLLQEKNNLILENKALNEVIERKQKLKDSENILYTNDLEAHAVHGIFVTKFNVGYETEGFNKQYHKLKEFLTEKAIESLKGVFLKVETEIKIDKDTGEKYFEEWIKSVTSGIVTSQSSKDGNIKINSDNIVVINRVKFIPRIASEKNNNFDGQNFVRKENPFDIVYIKNSSDINSYINNLKKLDISIVNLKKLRNVLTSKLKYVDSLNFEVNKYKREIFNRYLHKIRLIENDITKINNLLEKNKMRIEEIQKIAEEQKAVAENYYNRATGILLNIQNTNDVLMDIMNKSFRVRLAETGDILVGDEDKKEYLRDLIVDVISSLKERYNVVSETIESNVRNGLLLNEKKSKNIYKKEFLNADIYTDTYFVNSHDFISVVVDLDALISPINEIRLSNFNDKKDALDKHLLSINRLHDVIFNKKIEEYNTEEILNSGNNFNTNSNNVECDKCISVGNIIYNFSLFEDYRTMDDISFKITTPEKVATSYDIGGKWRLPSKEEILKILDYFKTSGNEEYDLSNRIIYTHGMYDKNHFNCVYIDENFELDNSCMADETDEAFIILIGG